VLDGITQAQLTEKGAWKPSLPTPPKSNAVDLKTLETWLKTDQQTVVVDLSTHANYVKGHIPGSWFILRSQLAQDIGNLPTAKRYVLSSGPAELSLFTAQEFSSFCNAEVFVLSGGNTAWTNAGLELEKGPSNLASPALDRYKRPYEGTNVDPAAMQAYLDWEFGLVDQLGKDGTHHFWVL
jgi:3-mercaptopyruvate sulfurtransferase SseA